MKVISLFSITGDLAWLLIRPMVSKDKTRKLGMLYGLFRLGLTTIS